MKRFLPDEHSLSAASCLLGALALLVLPLKFLLSAFLAAAVHECCHLAVLRMCRVNVRSIKFGVGGAVITTSSLPPLQELLCAIAGPAGSLLCLLLAKRQPLFALCGFVQGVYNLLPVYPLDGGRILRCCAQLLLPSYADILCVTLERCAIFSVFSLSLWLAHRSHDPIFLLLGGYFLLRTLPKRKIPCKAGPHWVQ